MGNHNNETVFCNLLQKIHNLHACLCIKCTGRFIRKQNLRIIDQCTRDCHTLHLSTGHLIWLFMDLATESNLLEHFLRPASALALRDTRQGQCQLDILQHRLVHDQIIALEYKTNAMVPIGIPVLILVFLCCFSLDYQIAIGVLIELSHDIQECCLSTTGMSKNRNKFICPKSNTDSL